MSPGPPTNVVVITTADRRLDQHANSSRHAIVGSQTYHRTDFGFITRYEKATGANLSHVTVVQLKRISL
jgi:hypothetical protein